MRSKEPHEPEFVSICPRCFREVSNRAYFAGRKGSAHFRGTCSPSPSPYFVRGEDVETYQEYVRKWVAAHRVALLGPSAPAFAYKIFNRHPVAETAEQWIADHPEIAHANAMSMAENLTGQALKAGLAA